MPAHDVAIYALDAASYYDQAESQDSGGAERQTVLLARELARRGLRVAHVVHPVAEPVPESGVPVRLVQRPVVEADGSATKYLAAKSTEVWRGLAAADASVQVFRGADGTLGVGGLWARAHRRKLIFAGANNADFTVEHFQGVNDPRARLFRTGMRLVDALVVQSADQQRLAAEHFPKAPAPEQVNSFVEPAPVAEGGGEAFLWVSRTVDYKRPLLYADLAEAVPEARFWMIATRSENKDLEAWQELEARAARLDNFELLPQRPHAELQALIGRAIAMVNTSSFEGMPNTWLEGWARGVPALTFSFDPDGRIARHDLGVNAEGDWDAFVAATRRLWERRADRDGRSATVRDYVSDAHGTQVGDRWFALVERLLRG